MVAAYVHSNSVHYSWHHSVVQLMAYDAMANQRVARGGWVAMRCGTGSLVQARNEAIEAFLRDDKADWLFWVDTDMGFEPDTVDRLFEAADPVERPIIGGLCFSQREDEQDGFGGHRFTVAPTVYDWARTEDDQMGWVCRWDFQPDTLTRVSGTGSACILIHRSVFEKIEAEHGRVWYDRVQNTTTGQLISEDLSFCLRAGALKLPIWIHTGVLTTHAKMIWMGLDDYLAQRALNNLREVVTSAQAEPAEATP